MKNYLLMAFAVLFTASNAQNSPGEKVSPSNFIYVSPIDLFLKTFELGYERSLKNSNSVAITGGFKMAKTNNDLGRIGGNGEIQYRVNLMYSRKQENIVGSYSMFAYFAPFFSYRYEQINKTDLYDTRTPQTNSTFINSGFGGVGFGCRFTGLANRFSCNIFTGGGLKYSDVKGLNEYIDFFDVGYTGFAPKLSIQLGIAF